jgi:L-amino acid N-acyltransferase YncA
LVSGQATISILIQSHVTTKRDGYEQIDSKAFAMTDQTNANASVTIRCAESGDLEAITAIYNEAILTTTATFDTETKTVAERTEWFRSHDERHPVLVADVAGQVVGWSSITKWSDRKAYDDTAETSFYVKAEYRGRGIGRKLKQATLDQAQRLGFHTLIARVAEGSNESLHLNESFGFHHVGTLKQVGRKFGRLLDVHILQKMLG